MNPVDGNNAEALLHQGILVRPRDTYVEHGYDWFVPALLCVFLLLCAAGAMRRL